MGDEILVQKKNGLGLITLNRPKALNALTHSMIRLMYQALKEWEQDPEVLAVLVRGEGEKAFCAGGDIRSIYESITSGCEEHTQFFRDEYILNEYIYAYPKPYIALMNGYVMGGGMGISQGASFRVLTEHSKVSMPEVAIGFFPDVGGSYFLSRSPGSLGNYLALTGVTLNGEDALYANLGDWILSSNHILEFLEKLEYLSANTPAAEQVKKILVGLGASNIPVNASLVERRQLIDAIFSLDGVVEIIAQLDQLATDGPAWISEIAELMKKRSPVAMVGALETIRRGKYLSIAECLAMELALGARWIEIGDFVEGIRALIIDKDNAPKWAFTLSELTQQKVKDLFPSLPKI
jgi:enoyl-CoA hydratase/carnithine racemase